MLYVPATVEEGLHIQVLEDGEELLVGEAVEARLVVIPLEAAEVVSLQQILLAPPFFASG